MAESAWCFLCRSDSRTRTLWGESVRHAFTGSLDFRDRVLGVGGYDVMGSDWDGMLELTKIGNDER